jgi:hypothetical protein
MSRNKIFVRIGNMEDVLFVCYLTRLSLDVTVINEMHRIWCSSQSIIRIITTRRMRWAEHVARLGETRNASKLLVGKPEEQRPLGRQRRRWMENIKIYLTEIGLGGMDWLDLA